MKTILIVSDIFSDSEGSGGTRIAYQQACLLREHDYDVTIFTSCQDKKKEGWGQYKGFDVYRVYSNFSGRMLGIYSIYYPSAVRALNRVIKKKEYQYVHFHNVCRYLSYACYKTASQYCKKIFNTIHDYNLIAPDKFPYFPDSSRKDFKLNFKDKYIAFKRTLNPFRNFLIKRYFGYIDQAFCVSRAQKDILEINGYKNLEVIYNGIEFIDDEKVNDSEVNEFLERYNLYNKKVILFIGRMSVAKGGLILPKILEKVKKKVNNISLLILGSDDSVKENILNQSDGITSGNVVTTGWVDRREVLKAYRVADVLLTPSIYPDPFPTVNLEAMLCRKPVVATSLGGSKEVVMNNITGFVVNPFNIDEIVEKVSLLLNNKDLAKKFGDAGYARIREKFTLGQQISQILEFYEAKNQ